MSSQSKRFLKVGLAVGVAFFLLAVGVWAAVISVNIDSPTEANPVYVKPGDTFTVQYDAAGDEVVTVKVYLDDSTQIYQEQVNLPVSNRQVQVQVPGGTAAGKYDLKVEAIGTSTKSDTENDAVIVDTTGPTVTITDIPGCVGALAQISGTADDDAAGVAEVYVSIKNNTDGDWWDGSAWVTTQQWLLASGTTSWSYNTSTVSWESGDSYTVWAKARDGAGNWTPTPYPSDTFTVDLTAPSVAITNPPSGWVKSLTQLQGTASDTGCAGLDKVYVQIYNVTGNRWWNGSQWVATATWVQATVTMNWSYSMPTLTSGRTYQVKAKATDTVGNSAETAAYQFQYDDVEPTEAILVPQNNKHYNASSIPGTFSGTASDDASGVQKVEVSLQRSSDSKWWDGSTWIITQTVLQATGTANWTYNASAVTWDDGVWYTLNAKATDNAGNDPGVFVQFLYDTTKPTVTLGNIADKVGCETAPTSFSGTAGDTLPGAVDKVFVRIKDNMANKYWDGDSWEDTETWLQATGTANWTYNAGAGFAGSLQDAHSYTVSAKSVDKAGNESNLAQDTFSYDACPTVAFASPGEGAILQDLDEFTGTAADAGTGSVQGVKVMIQKGTSSEYWNCSDDWVTSETWCNATDTSAGGDWSTWKYDTSGISWPDEEYVLHAKAQDDSEQWSEDVERNVILDGTPPDVTVDPIDDNTQPTSFSGDADDEPAGMDWVKVAISYEEDTTTKCWNGSAWVAGDPAEDDFCWLEAMLGSSWSYDASGVAFQGGTEYTVWAKGADKAGNESEPNFVTFEYGSSADIPLGAGWNLISLPLIPNNEAIAEVMAGLNVDWVTTFVWQNGVLVEKKWDPPIQQLTTMTTGQGYWVKMFSAGTLRNAGLFQPRPPAVPKSYTLYPGWNLIGYHATTQEWLDTPKTVAEYLGPTILANTRAMYYYEGGMYKAVTNPSTTTMEVGYGYWLALDAGGTLYPRTER